jgi:hemimethylated DNA binding protein
MQPVRIGMNAAVVLLVLLLSVPLQLLLSSSLSSSPSVEQGDDSGDVTDARTEAVEQLVDTAESIFDTLHSTVAYYSTWNHLKELVLVPYRKTPRTNLKSTVFKSKAGTTTILISGMDDTKTKKKSTSASATASSTKTSSSTRSSVSSQAGKMGSNSGTQREATVKQQFHKSKSSSQQNTPDIETEKVQTGSKMKTSTKTGESNSKSQVIEEVSRAKEVDEYLMNEVYFGQSKKPRDRRSLAVKFSVGQIVRHKTANYVGVVIGWDEVAKAPDKWIKHYYGNRKGVELTTHYHVLIDSKYIASGTPYYYVPQEDLEFGPLQQLRCPEVSEYFERFQSGRYVPKPWLRVRYPMD